MINSEYVVERVSTFYGPKFEYHVVGIYDDLASALVASGERDVEIALPYHLAQNEASMPYHTVRLVAGKGLALDDAVDGLGLRAGWDDDALSAAGYRVGQVDGEYVAYKIGS